MENKLEWIESQLLPKESASEAASRLNATIRIDNPDKQQQVSVPIDLVLIRNTVPDLEAFNVLNSRIWDRITDAISIGDLVAVQSHIAALLAGGLISVETAQKLAPFLSATIPDPNYQSQIDTTLARSAGYDDVLVAEVQSVIDND